MTTQDMDILAHKIVSLEKRHNALARAQQLPNSSVRLVDGADVGLAESAEATRDIGDEAAYLGDWLTDADNNLDDNAEYGVEVPEWIQDAGYAGDVAWDSTQFATDLALTLDTELTQAQQELEQAQIDLTQALADSATALQEAQEALQEAEDAVTAVGTATAAASAAEATAQAAQTAAGTAQTTADQAAADALAAANAAIAADSKAEAAQGDASAAATDAAQALSDASAASAAADAANAEALAAAGIANAKGRVIYQPTAPTGANASESNLWIRTSDNKPHTYDGSGWVAVTDQAVVDAAAAASVADGKAVAAATAASNAQSAAEAAQTTAEAKGKVIIQPGAPNAADRLPQNLWIDTTGGNNTPKRWDGSDWVVVTDKAATDAAAAAVTAQDRADDAYDEALSAATAAGNAQTSADGKTTNWYQDDAPAGTAHKVGDTWFDTNDGNRIYRWNGSWVAAQFGTNAISDTAINASKLAANAVTEGKILNGAITNDKLDTAVQNAITTAQSTASNAQTVANSAQSVANAAQTAAGNAQGDATQAIADALAAANAAATKVPKESVGAGGMRQYRDVLNWYSGVPAAAGWLVIRTTMPFTGPMISAKLSISQLSRAEATADFSMYLYAINGGTIHSPSYSSYGATELTFKFAKTPENTLVILISQTGSWAYPRLSITELQVGYTTPAGLVDGWAVAIQTDISEFDSTVVNATSHNVPAEIAAKGKTIIQSAAPAAADRLPQNLWIDTTGGANTPKRWVSGTTWAVVTDKAATDAAAAAVTAQNAANAAQSRADDAHTIASGAATAASAAASAASAAQTAANNAQTTANGKNKIVRSTADASSPGNYVAGDQWWKYNGSQITAMWIHSGSAWVSQTLTDSVITNLNAGSITAGTIASARLSATNIKSVLINAGAIQTANIAAGAITAASGIIADAAIGTAKIIDGSITTAKIENLAVTNAEIANGTIQHAKIGSVDAAKITVGTLNAARIAANTISAQKLLLTSFENLAQDYSFEYNSTEAWQMVSNAANETTNPRSGSRALRITTTTGAFVAARQVGRFSVAGGERYRVSAWVRLDSGTSALTGVTLRFAHSATESGGGTTTSDVATTPTGTGTTYVQISGVWTVPAAARFAYLEIISRDTTSGKKYRVDDVEIYKMASGELIVDGAITATKLSTNAVVADKIASNAVTAVKINANAVTSAKINAGAVTTVKLDALAVTAEKIAANAITAGKIQAEAIDGMTITGALIRTAPSGQRMQFDVNGLQAYDSGGVSVATISTGVGGLRIGLRETGVFQTTVNAHDVSAGVSRTPRHDGGNNYARLSASDSFSDRMYDAASLQLSAGSMSSSIMAFGGNTHFASTSGGFYFHSPVTINGTLNSTTQFVNSSRLQKTLWTGAVYLNSSQTANLSELVSEQLNGIILVWSRYSSGTAHNDSWNFTYIPKAHTAYANGSGVSVPISHGSASARSQKYVYVHDNRVVGNDFNGTAPNNWSVLRRVLGY